MPFQLNAENRPIMVNCKKRFEKEFNLNRNLDKQCGLCAIEFKRQTALHLKQKATDGN